MAVIQQDLSNTKPQDFSPIPPGLYRATVVDSEVGRSDAGNNRIKWEWEVTDEQYSGRKLWDYMVLQGSDESVRIGQSRLKAMAEACGHPNPNFINDTEDLHGLECLVKLGIKKGKDGYDDSNKITAFKPLTSGGVPASPHQPQQQTAPPPPPVQQTAPPPTQQTQPAPAQPQTQAAPPPQAGPGQQKTQKNPWENQGQQPPEPPLEAYESGPQG